MRPERHSDSLSRRDCLRIAAAVAAGLPLSGWLDRLAVRAAGTGKKTKSCILLWMNGGPSHTDTFDPKPDARVEVRGELKAIATSAPGVQVSELFPKFARQMHHAAIIRSMTTGRTGDHRRAVYYVHTGYPLRPTGLLSPALGAVVSRELGRADFPLPSFVWIRAGSQGSGGLENITPGYLGPEHQPLAVQEPATGLENLKGRVEGQKFEDQVNLLTDLEQGFFRTYKAPAAHAHRTMLERAVRVMRSREAEAFDLSREPDAARAAYGNSKVGEACLMARRLVEAGVPFVEVGNPGWDTHGNGYAEYKQLCPPLDTAVSALIPDLQSRGLLERTLIIMMGEFGRTPWVKSGGGRDHWPRVFSAVLCGGGIKGGQVIGSSDKESAEIADRPVTVQDFMATVCAILGIDYTKEYDANGRPMRIVEKGETPIRELLA